MKLYGFVSDSNPKEAKAAFDLIRIKVTVENVVDLIEESENLCEGFDLLSLKIQ